jgi:phosphomannomutase
MDAALLTAVRTWLRDDPDAADRAELEHLLDAADETALVVRFGPLLRFGTAGIRGPMRAGPSGMNTATVARTAAGLAGFLPLGASVVVGYDGRHRSPAFARTCAEVLVGAGCDARLIENPVPTPLLAFAVRHLGADAGVMITASHNPPADNGLKLYLGGPAGEAGSGAQIAPPVDGRVEDAIRRVGPAAGLPTGASQVVPVAELTESYLTAITGSAGSAPARRLRIAYTPLHGVGLDLMEQAFRRAGFDHVSTVVEQGEPDPDFPTVPFPNPEVPGALDRLVALVQQLGADLGLASDPDADRCAAVLGSRVLTGDEIGCLLADAVLRRTPGPVATSLVSSSLLPAMARHAGVDCHVTLTGFKNLMRADPALVFAYEEALGYAVAPEVVRDKDGISAALLLAEFAEELAAEGRTLIDRLDELMADFGLHLTRGVVVRVPDVAAARELTRSLHGSPPARLGDVPVVAVEPLRSAGTVLPDEDGVVLWLEAGRVIVRPSGTEPTVKAYLELVRPVRTTVVDARREAAPHLDALAEAVDALLRADPQRSN